MNKFNKITVLFTVFIFFSLFQIGKKTASAAFWFDYDFYQDSKINLLDIVKNQFVLIKDILSFYGCDSNKCGNIGSFFTVSVVDESFCLYSTNPQTIKLATDNYNGLNRYFPAGPVLPGNGGYNYGFGGLPNNKYWRWWSWQMDPAKTEMVEAAIEICDGLPSAVEYGPLDIGQYCPWTAKVTALGCPKP